MLSIFVIFVLSAFVLIQISLMISYIFYEIINSSTWDTENQVYQLTRKKIMCLSFGNAQKIKLEIHNQLLVL